MFSEDSLVCQDGGWRREQLEAQLIEALDSDFIEVDLEELEEKDLVTILRDKLAGDVP